MRADLDALRDQLAELEDHLSQVGPVGDLPRGLAREESRALAEADGLRLTDELVEFFAWHDGFGNFSVPMDRPPSSLAHSLQDTRSMKQEGAALMARDLGIEAEKIWTPHWYAFNTVWGFMGGPVFDLSVPPEARTPVLGLGEDFGDDYALRAFESLADLISAWNRHIQLGVTVWDGHGWRPGPAPSPFTAHEAQRRIMV